MLSFISYTCQLVVTEFQVTTSKLGDIVSYEYKSMKDYLRNRKKKRELKRRMKHATSYSEWEEHALQYDDMTGEWKLISAWLNLSKKLRDGEKLLQINTMISISKT